MYLKNQSPCVSHLSSLRRRGLREGYGSFLPETLELRVLVIPIGFLAASYILSAGYLINFWNGHWQRTARHFLLVSVVGGIFWIFLFLLLSAHQVGEASRWYPFSAVFSLLTQLAAWEAVLCMVEEPVPRWHRLLWLIAGALSAGVLLIPHSLAHSLTAVPDGYWLRPDHPTLLWWLVALFYSVCLVAAFFTQVKKGWSSGTRRLRTYAVLGLLSIPFYWNDIIQVQLGPTFYPLIWVAGLLWLLELWIEIHHHTRWIQRQIVYDDLTGAYTRSFGRLYASQQLERRSLGLVFFDLDNLKTINDRYGHLIGDHILRMAVSRIQTGSAAKDKVVRWGGDEFLVVYPGARPDHRARHIDRVQQALCEPPLWVSGMAVQDAAQVSFGWASGPRGSALDRLIDEADREMYEMKSAKPHRRPPTPDPPPLGETP